MYFPDISHYHPVKNWEDVKKNCGFLVSKATQGTNYIDNTLDSFIAGCEKHKIPYWLYTYLNKGDERKQAEFLVKVCKSKVGKYFVGYVLDIEEKNIASNVQSALDYLKTQSTKTMIYTMYAQYDMYSSLIAKRPSTCAWWEARYGKNNGVYSKAFSCHVGADLQQYTSQGYCPGIGNNVDLNRLTGAKTLDFFTNTGKDISNKGSSSTNKPTKNVTVKVGSARIDENGRAGGGRAGDQTGKEVAIENWYYHSLGWYVLRAKDSAKREKIAQDMEYACNNATIGYDQYQNTTLWSVASKVGYNCKKVTTPCETDCARLVRVCCWYAGIKCDDFYTATERTVLMNTGQFDLLTESKYCNQSAYLKRGDILVTRSKGHTVVVLNDGDKAYNDSSSGSNTDELRFTYAVRVEHRQILPEVVNLNDYAGRRGMSITDIAIKVNKGKVRYRVHVRDKDWLPWVTGYDWNDYDNGYAGNGRQIDAVQVELLGVSGQKAQYRVSPVNKDYYDWQYNVETTNGQDGYAGSFGKPIDRFQIY